MISPLIAERKRLQELLDDFIEGAALFSDVFAQSGMKIVLSGTDSLGFLFSEDEQLYDRCVLLHTTFVPYREFEGVLDITAISQSGLRYAQADALVASLMNDGVFAEMPLAERPRTIGADTGVTPGRCPRRTARRPGSARRRRSG